MPPAATHSIRLAGPWTFEWLGDAAKQADAGRITMPCDWRTLFGDQAGQVRFQRSFNWPVPADADERIELVFSAIGGTALVTLNERSLGSIDGADGETRFDVTSLLQPVNRLDVLVQFDPGVNDNSGGLHGPVRLEITAGSTP